MIRLRRLTAYDAGRVVKDLLLLAVTAGVIGLDVWVWRIIA